MRGTRLCDPVRNSGQPRVSGDPWRPCQRQSCAANRSVGGLQSHQATGHWRAINPGIAGSMTVTGNVSGAQVRAVIGPDLSDSQADNPDPASVTRSDPPWCACHGHDASGDRVRRGRPARRDALSGLAFSAGTYSRKALGIASLTPLESGGSACNWRRIMFRLTGRMGRPPSKCISTCTSRTRELRTRRPSPTEPGYCSQLLISVLPRVTRCTRTRPDIRFASAGHSRLREAIAAFVGDRFGQREPNQGT